MLEEGPTLRTVELFDDILQVTQNINDILGELTAFEYCVGENVVEKVRHQKNEMHAYRAALKEQLAITLVAARSGKEDATEFDKLINNARYDVKQNQAKCENIHDSVQEKIDFAKMCRQNKIRYIARKSELSELLSESGKLVALFASTKLRTRLEEDWRSNQIPLHETARQPSDDKELESSKTLLLRLLKTENHTVVFVDCDFDIQLEQTNKAIIKEYDNGKCTSIDYEQRPRGEFVFYSASITQDAQHQAQQR